MPKMTCGEVGRVKVKQLENGRWQARFWDAEARKMVRRILPVGDYKKAIESAGKINNELAAEDGYIPRRRAPKRGHTVSGAIDETIALRRASGKTKAQYADMANKFTAWLTEHFPNITQWNELKPFHLEAYIQHCMDAGLSFDTVRLRFVPIRSTSIFMADNYEEHGYRDIARKVKLPKRPPIKREAALGDADLSALLLHMAEHGVNLWPVAVCQSLAGLRVLEALALREQDIDFEGGTITITDTPDHKVKTAESERTIPVGEAVLSALRWALKTRKIITAEGHVFISRRGKPYAVNGYFNVMKRAFKAAERDCEIEGLADMRPRELRACFATLARSLGADKAVVQKYLGQAARDILGRHYDRIGVDRMRSEIVERTDATAAAKTAIKNAASCALTDIAKNATADIIALTG